MVAMDRRSFFRSATVGAGATALSLVGSANAMTPEKIDESDLLGEKPPRRTAVSMTVTPCSFDPLEVDVIRMPPGFIPRAVSCSMEEVVISLLDDDDAPLFEVEAPAFRHGPLELWRDVRGKLRCRVECYTSLSVLPTVTITIYGEIPRQRT